MNIRQTDPLAGYLERKTEIDAAVQKVLAGGWYINGEEVAAFEREFAAFFGATHGVGVASGTDALQLALRGLGLGAGDQIITTSHTAVATVAAIELTGAEAVVVDIDPASYTMSLPALTEAIATLAPKGRLKAIVAVHLYGHPADIAAIVALAKQHQLFVVEDCAQSHGARVDGKLACSFGDVAAFSFYPTKNLGAFGDGGAIITSDGALAERVRWLREYGWKERYISHLAGLNSRLDELHAAMLRVKLRYLAADNERRRAIARLYDERLPRDMVSPPTVKAGIEHSYHQYVVRSGKRDKLREALHKQGIATAIHYPQPVHLQPAYRGRIVQAGPMTATEQACPEIISLPMYAQLPLADAERVCAAIADAKV